ncbi:MAG: MarR family transcriptional regulator [Lachnospiraceae bacterium]|nr:MarR family transcriptional regulator [Lachnospiraceae bacterium]
MLEEVFSEVYNKFKLHFYKKLFERLDDRETSLTTVETFCMETIYAMKEPSINEFATFLGISTPNAAYKVNSLVKKGYVEKIQSEDDKREYHLKPTKKYVDYYDISNAYRARVMERAAKRFTKAELDKLEEMLSIISEELMKEVNYKHD